MISNFEIKKINNEDLEENFYESLQNKVEDESNKNREELPEVKITSTQFAEKFDCNFCTGCVEVAFASRQKARH